MILNILGAFFTTTICMFLGLTILHTFGNVPYNKIVVRPHIAVSTATSFYVAWSYGTSHTESMLCFIAGLIGCFLGQEAFKKAFEPKEK